MSRVRSWQANPMSGKPRATTDRRDPELERLIEAIVQAASGTSHKDFEGFTRSGHSEPIRRIAEGFGMMVDNMQAREYHLEHLDKELKAGGMPEDHA